MPRSVALRGDGRRRPRRRARCHLLRRRGGRHAARAARGDRRERGLREGARAQAPRQRARDARRAGPVAPGHRGAARRGAWPEWSTFLWLPALVGAILPAPRRWALVGMAVVAGTAAALLAWGATVEGRLALGTRDAQRLGQEGDAVAVALLERLSQQVALAPTPPRTAGDLYALWVGSPLVAEDYPAMLELWSPGPERLPTAELQLAQLDLPPALLSTLAQTATEGGPCIERLERIPGIHYVLVAPLQNGTVLTIGVGPRTRLLPPDRVARFLRGDPGVEPPYTISLSGGKSR